MNREELIEEARAAFTEAWEAEDGRMRRLGIINDPDHPRSRAGIIAALAVFEKADAPTDTTIPRMLGPVRELRAAPTDDEREALRNLLYQSNVIPFEAIDPITDRILERFRCSEVPEPSVEHAEDILDRASLDEYLRVDPDETYERLVIKANTLASTVRRLLVSSTQGEPSDAQIQAALEAYWGVMNVDRYGSIEGMRAALRAAGGVR